MLVFDYPHHKIWDPAIFANVEASWETWFTSGLTVRVLADDRAYWRNAKDPWARTEVSKLTDVFKKFSSDKQKIVIIQIDRDSKFDNMVHIIDELDLAGLSRFSLGTLDDAGKKAKDGRYAVDPAADAGVDVLGHDAEGFLILGDGLVDHAPAVIDIAQPQGGFDRAVAAFKTTGVATMRAETTFVGLRSGDAG